VDARVKPAHDDANAVRYLSLVMPGFMPGIHVFLCYRSSSAGGSNQFVSDRPPSTTKAAPVT